MKTIVHLFKFQKSYLKQLLDNVPEEKLYAKQLNGYNSAGWILGHLCVEAEDVFNYFNIPYQKLDKRWSTWFKNSSGEISTSENLPTKKELLAIFEKRYLLLCDVYESLSSKDRTSRHLSTLLKDKLPDIDSWFAHHLTTHIAIHCGNIVVWKKLIGLQVNGY